MARHSTLSFLRGSLLLAGCAAGSAGAWALARDPLLDLARPLLDRGVSAVPALAFGDVLAGGCAAALLGCVGWVLTSTALVVAAHLARLLAPDSAVLLTLSGLAERGCPAAARALVAVTLGLAVGTAAAAPALADPSGGSAGDAASGVLTGLALPDRATGQAPATSAPRTASQRPDRVVVVRPGDSLWSIAAGLLGHGAGDARVNRAWHRLHHANLSRIGDDPDLIQPGTRLLVPEAIASDRKEPQ